jgi:hypothetical protein
VVVSSALSMLFVRQNMELDIRVHLSVPCDNSVSESLVNNFRAPLERHPPAGSESLRLILIPDPDKRALPVFFNLSHF